MVDVYDIIFCLYIQKHMVKTDDIMLLMLVWIVNLVNVPQYLYTYTLLVHACKMISSTSR